MSPAVTTAPCVPSAPPESFAALRDALVAAQFDEASVAARLDVQSLYNVKRIVDGRTTLAGPVEDANAALIRLMIDGEALPAALVERLLGRAAFEALGTLGLVAPTPT